MLFDLSEDTGLPYIITIKTPNLEFIIDEINNNFYYKKRPKKMKTKPLNYYLFKPELYQIAEEITNKYEINTIPILTIKKVLVCWKTNSHGSPLKQ